ncbi:glycosyltransferase [Marinobacter sp. SS13-12]|uniref:glycosyltransferase n=1 Tax=Marinobacter sp. SS13-12 TaxID=3050451 RepID=UPI0025562AA4|nr:glycosyltransferase [Marinobacter sp. SS13-12]MDK8463844.1 glycosyltransferase [Marinobacter sp. SS13-12]
MHILLLPSWYPGHAGDVKGVFFRDQALALLNHGHKVGVIAPMLRSLRTLTQKSGRRSIPFCEMDMGIPTYREDVLAALPRVPYGNYWLFKRAANVLLKNYIEHYGKPDILHAHCTIFGGSAAADLARKYGIPMVLTEHSSGFARNLYADWQLRLVGKGIAGACSCISVSPSLGEILGKQFVSSKDQWHWIPNVVADRFNASKGLKRRHGSFIFLNLALMTENKGQLELIEAFHSIASDNPTTELWLAGDGPIKKVLEKKASELGLSDKVHFLGMVAPEKVPELLGKADVMVVASHYETFGVVAAEALMTGLPVIATRCGGPECIVEKGDGLLVPTRNPKALAAAMQKLLENIESFDSCSIAKRAHDRFSGSAIAGMLTEEYTRVINANKNELDCA